MPSTSTATALPPETATKTSSNIDMEALTPSITAAVTNAVQATMKTPHLPTDIPPASESASTTLAPMLVEEAVCDQLAILTSPTADTKEPGSSGASSTLDNSDKLVFSSLALNLQPAESRRSWRNMAQKWTYPARIERQDVTPGDDLGCKVTKALSYNPRSN